MKKVFIGIPTSEYQHFLFTQSLIGLISHATKQGIQVTVQQQEGNRTDRNRNLILKEALSVDWDYFLWLDSDMVYPHDLITTYLKSEDKGWDVIGCLYFKRKKPYVPIGYLSYGTKKGRYRAIDPVTLTHDDVVRVVALGYGGMMVKREVYEGLGDDKWTRYGYNFHLPDTQDSEYGTHDVVFCDTVIAHGYKIFLHGGVRPTHIATVEIGEEDYSLQIVPPPTVTVIMPTIHPDMAQKTAKILSSRAGYAHKMIVMEDKDKSGFVALCNQAVKDFPSDYYVYVTDDIFPSRFWLRDSIKAIEEKDCGLLGYDDGKWEGAIATCGLIKHSWMVKNYNGDMFYPDYFGHYNDTELTMLAMNDKTYCYNPNISLIEVDYEKDKKSVHSADKKLYARRKRNGFDGRITDSKLLEAFS